jgi:hypothetical protein
MPLKAGSHKNPATIRMDKPNKLFFLIYNSNQLCLFIHNANAHYYFLLFLFKRNILY